MIYSSPHIAREAGGRIRSDTGQDGFVLVAVLWVLVMMTLFVGYFSDLVSQSQNQAYLLREDLQFELDRQATLATITYLSTTRSMSYAGLRVDVPDTPAGNPVFGADPFMQDGSELRLDGRWYRGIGDVRFALQDAGSLISLRGQGGPRLDRLLENLGVEGTQRNRLIANLVDYQDRDHLESLNGAEERDYRLSGKLPPLNRFIVSPVQIVNVLGWETQFEGGKLYELLKEVTVYVADRQNFNTMTPAGMRTIGLEGMDSNAIEKIIERRKAGSFRTVSEVNQLTGTLVPGDPFSSPLLPSRHIRVVFQRGERAQEEWIGLTLTPDSRIKPWQIDYDLVLNTSTSDEGKNAVVVAENPETSLFR